MSSLQETHYGCNVPEEHQPKCKGCSGHMALTIMIPNNKLVAFWYCQDANDITNENFCEFVPFEQVTFLSWMDEVKDKNIKKHFENLVSALPNG